MDIRKFAVNPTTRLHLRDAADELMYLAKLDASGAPEKDEHGAEVPDLAKPIAVNLYGPGSKQYSQAQAANSNRMIDKLKRKGKTNQSAAEKAEEQAEFLSACTASWENMEYDKLQGDFLSKAVYTDITIGFIAEQVGKHLGEWGNFTKASSTTSPSASGA